MNPSWGSKKYGLATYQKSYKEVHQGSKNTFMLSNDPGFFLPENHLNYQDFLEIFLGCLLRLLDFKKVFKKVFQGSRFFKIYLEGLLRIVDF